MNFWGFLPRLWCVSVCGLGLLACGGGSNPSSAEAKTSAATSMLVRGSAVKGVIRNGYVEIRELVPFMHYPLAPLF